MTRFLPAAALAAALAAPAAAQNTGLQAVGLSAFSAKDVTKTADVVAAAAAKKPGEYEVTFLPTTFNTGQPYQNATDLAKNLLPRIPGSRLRLTAYMWFRTWDKMDWPAFTAARPTKKQRDFLDAFDARVKDFDVWAAGLQGWADANRVGDRLRFTFCASLEDDCKSPAQYTAMLGRVLARQSADGVSVPIRRSPLTEKTYLFRAQTPAKTALPLELHGRWSEVTAAAKAANVRLEKGDSFSNDGEVTPRELTAAEFRADQAAARRAGLHSFYWRSGFNGPQGKHPSKRGVLKPFTGTGGKAAYDASVQVVSDR